MHLFWHQSILSCVSLLQNAAIQGEECRGNCEAIAVTISSPCGFSSYLLQTEQKRSAHIVAVGPAASV